MSSGRLCPALAAVAAFRARDSLQSNFDAATEAGSAHGRANEAGC